MTHPTPTLTPTPTFPADRPLVITTLAGLRAAMDKPLTCEFEIDGQIVQLPVRRVTTPIDELRRQVLRGPMPPYVAERKEYDALNASYRAQRDRAEDEARSLIVYHCCPEVAAGSPGLTEAPAIHSYVKGLLPPTVLELIALTAMAGGLSTEVNKRANFISIPVLES